MHSHYDSFSSAVVVSRRRESLMNDLESVTELKSYNIEVLEIKLKARIVRRLLVEFISMTMPKQRTMIFPFHCINEWNYPEDCN